MQRQYEELLEEQFSSCKGKKERKNSTDMEQAHRSQTLSTSSVDGTDSDSGLSADFDNSLVNNALDDDCCFADEYPTATSITSDSNAARDIELIANSTVKRWYPVQPISIRIDEECEVNGEPNGIDENEKRTDEDICGKAGNSAIELPKEEVHSTFALKQKISPNDEVVRVLKIPEKNRIKTVFLNVKLPSIRIGVKKAKAIIPTKKRRAINLLLKLNRKKSLLSGIDSKKATTTQTETIKGKKYCANSESPEFGEKCTNLNASAKNFIQTEKTINIRFQAGHQKHSKAHISLQHCSFSHVAQRFSAPVVPDIKLAAKQNEQLEEKPERNVRIHFRMTMPQNEEEHVKGVVKVRKQHKQIFRAVKATKCKLKEKEPKNEEASEVSSNAKQKGDGFEGKKWTDAKVENLGFIRSVRDNLKRAQKGPKQKNPGKNGLEKAELRTISHVATFDRRRKTRNHEGRSLEPSDMHLPKSSAVAASIKCTANRKTKNRNKNANMQSKRQQNEAEVKQFCSQLAESVGKSNFAETNDMINNKFNWNGFLESANGRDPTIFEEEELSDWEKRLIEFWWREIRRRLNIPIPEALIRPVFCSKCCFCNEFGAPPVQKDWPLFMQQATPNQNEPFIDDWSIEVLIRLQKLIMEKVHRREIRELECHNNCFASFVSPLFVLHRNMLRRVNSRQIRQQKQQQKSQLNRKKRKPKWKPRWRQNPESEERR